MRLDDDVYMNVEHLLDLVAGLDPTQPLFIGNHNTITVRSFYNAEY